MYKYKDSGDKRLIFEAIENENFCSTVLSINMLMMLCGPVGGRIRHEADSNPDSN